MFIEFKLFCYFHFVLYLVFEPPKEVFLSAQLFFGNVKVRSKSIQDLMVYFWCGPKMLDIQKWNIYVLLIKHFESLFMRDKRFDLVLFLNGLTGFFFLEVAFGHLCLLYARPKWCKVVWFLAFHVNTLLIERFKVHTRLIKVWKSLFFSYRLFFNYCTDVKGFSSILHRLNSFFNVRPWFRLQHRWWFWPLEMSFLLFENPVMNEFKLGLTKVIHNCLV